MAMRIYELAKKYNIPSKELVELLKDHGATVTSLGSVTPEVQALAEKILSKGKAPEKASETPETKQPEPQQKVIQTPIETKPVLEKKVEKELEEGKVISLEPMTLATFAQIAGVAVSDVIITLLKKGTAATINQLLSVDSVSFLAQHYGLKIIKKEAALDSKIIGSISEKAAGQWIERLPIVVVIGHVDHGKTTLLDFIRKTRVAAREKGGITQHLGAYEVKTSKGSIVFLDTPGHEAFSLMRVRGIKVADIAIVIVAADDGIKPQTLEAIKAAKNAEIPIIVAINKIDKASPAQIEVVKGQLSREDLTPEEWGGQTVCMPISAKIGTGIDELLEVIVLQSQLMDLKANVTIPGRGYVLESKLEKGRGPVATVLCQHGILKIGDYFAAGEVTGRVSSLVDSDGKRVKQVGPSTPVQVAGFTALPQAGDIFEVHPQKVIKKGMPASQQRADLLRRKAGAAHETDIDIIIKADNASSREAIVDALSRLKSEFGALSIIQSGIGDITESDVMFAADTGALIYGLHVKIQPTAQELIQKHSVTVKNFNIIYKLIEDVQALQEAAKPIEMVTKKIGEATVLKVFDIKNLGIIAGSIVREGRFVRNGKVKIYRGRTLVGEGNIKGLQRERKAVKEVHSGFECGFLVEGFEDWQVDDRVECYQETPA